MIARRFIVIGVITVAALLFGKSPRVGVAIGLAAAAAYAVIYWFSRPAGLLPCLVGMTMGLGIAAYYWRRAGTAS